MVTELDELKRRYEAGEFDALREDLEQFLRRHRAAIAAARREQERRGVPLSEEEAVRLYILRHRSINPERDMRDQLEEIRREAGRRAAGAPAADAEEVTLEWARYRSAAWRSYRLTAILYVFDREKDRYLGLLR
ncbi:MAG TPA: hypothetical protein VNO22_02970 [Planctomycetota bacterium]|nr:hypothetical protein [Planctomycetota bacterium]